MERPARFARWILPATGVSLAAIALSLLALEDAPRHGLGASPQASPQASRQTAGPAPERVADGSRQGADERPPLPRVAPRRPAHLAAGRSVLPKPAAAGVLPGETRAAVVASGHVVELARAGSLEERLRLLDALVARLPAERAAVVLEGLLDTPLPGSLYDRETLKLAVLGALGRVPGAEAGAALAGRLDPELPRPERLMAIELLAARPQAGRDALTSVAQRDHDSVVQARAQWALARTR